MIAAILITSTIWFCIGLGGLFLLSVAFEQQVNDIYEGIRKSSLPQPTKEQVIKLLKHYLDEGVE